MLPSDMETSASVLAVPGFLAVQKEAYRDLAEDKTRRPVSSPR